MPDLAAPNFIVRQGQMPLDVVSAQPAGPASVVFLVENSAASWNYLQDVNSAMRGFLAHARPQDGYALVSYGRDVRVEATLTSDPTEVARAFAGRTQSSWPDATLYDALDRLLDQTPTLPNRPVIVLIGSGLDRFSEAGYKQLLERIESEDVVIHAIQLGGTDPALRPQPKISADLRSMIAARTAAEQAPPDLNWGAMFLRAITTASGGRFFCPPCEAAFSSAVEQILQSLDADYRVVYRRAPERAAGKLRVEAFRLDDDVRTNFDVRVGRR
ncbi:MAG: VWA domain-containing protein [Bryobacterales bacterium]